MIDTIANFFLAFSHGTVIVPLALLGFIWLDRRVFYSATCLILTSILFNAALKNTFQVPLSPTLGKSGFAFPSGHMQASFVFYGWLAYKNTHKMVRIVVGILLLGIALGLMHFGYHNYIDVLGAVFFGSLIMMTYHAIEYKKPKILAMVFLTFATACTLYVYYFGIFLDHLWIACYALFGFIGAQRLFYKNNLCKKTQNKIVATIVSAVLISAIVLSFSSTFLINMPVYIQQIQWVLIGFSVPFAPFVANKILK